MNNEMWNLTNREETEELKSFENGGYANYSMDSEKKVTKLKKKIKKLKKRKKKQGFLLSDDDKMIKGLKRKLKHIKNKEKKAQMRYVRDCYNNKSREQDLERKNAMLSLMLLTTLPNKEKIMEKVVEEALTKGVLSYRQLPPIDTDYIDGDYKEV